MNKTRILLADDHSLMRMGLAFLINSQKDISVVGEATRAEAVGIALRKHLLKV